MTASTQAPARPEIGRAPARMILFRHHDQVAHVDLPTALGTSFADIYAHIGRAGVEPDGPPFVVYHRRTEAPVRWTIDVCGPITKRVEPPADLQFAALPAEQVVTLLHTGPYEQLGAAYEAVDHFVAANGLIPSGPPREIYLSEPDVPPERIQTLIEQPIRPE